MKKEILSRLKVMQDFFDRTLYVAMLAPLYLLIGILVFLFPSFRYRQIRVLNPEGLRIILMVVKRIYEPFDLYCYYGLRFVFGKLLGQICGIYLLTLEIGYIAYFFDNISSIQLSNISTLLQVMMVLTFLFAFVIGAELLEFETKVVTVRDSNITQIENLFAGNLVSARL